MRCKSRNEAEKGDKKHEMQEQERSGKNDKRMGCIDRNAWDMEGRKED